VLCRSQWPSSPRRKSTATHLLGLWFRIPLGAWMFVCCECRVLSGTGLCNELITHPEESYQLWFIVVCDLETTWMRRPWPTGGCCANNKQTIQCSTQKPFNKVLVKYVRIDSNVTLDWSLWRLVLRCWGCAWLHLCHIGQTDLLCSASIWLHVVLPLKQYRRVRV